MSPRTNINTRVKKAKALDPLTPLIDQYLLERQSKPKPWFPQEDFPRLPGRFSPSGMKCMRRDVFKYMGVKGKRKTTPEQQLIFDVGDWLHWMWFSNFMHMQRFFSPDVFRVVDVEEGVGVPALRMAGRFDVFVEIRGVLYIIDVKTINHRGFSERIHQRRADPQHVRQLTRYLRARKVPRGLVFYFDKDNQNFIVFAVNYKKERWQESRVWLKKANRYLDRGKVPPMHEDCTKGSYMYKDCPFSYLCYKVKDPAELRTITYAGKLSPQQMWEENN